MSFTNENHNLKDEHATLSQKLEKKQTIFKTLKTKLNKITKENESLESELSALQTGEHIISERAERENLLKTSADRITTLKKQLLEEKEHNEQTKRERDEQDGQLAASVEKIQTLRQQLQKKKERNEQIMTERAEQDAILARSENKIKQLEQKFLQEQERSKFDHFL
ncbi:trichohyalin-like [Pleurodeles waltl]|uniref:trichohyalin-like n=1 Tax=Pleurodeles waltl TaxID=8319 RepID=UPI003709BA33